jgi:hypothetical protein
LAVLVAGALVGAGLPAPAPADWLRGIEAAVLVITGVIVFWYTVETARLRVVSEEQLDQAAAQVRAGVRPVLQLEAEGDRLRIVNIGLGPALEVTVRAPALTGGMVNGGPGMWDCQFERVPVVPVNAEKQPLWHVTQDSPDRGRELVSPSLSRAVNQLPPTSPLPIEVTYLDSHLYRVRARFEFRRGEPIAFPVGVEELGPSTDPEPPASPLKSPTREPEPVAP